MKTDIKGCSTTQAGQEQYEKFKAQGQTFLQYDYRLESGKLFTCVAKTLAIARQNRDRWVLGHDCPGYAIEH